MVRMANKLSKVMLTFLDIGLLDKIFYPILHSINQILWWVGVTKQY